MPDPSSHFLFLTCQIGAEPAVKSELARLQPGFRFAYSRPGFLTFKLPAGLALAPDFDLTSAFARAYAISLGKVTAETETALAVAAWEMAREAAKTLGLTWERLHVWQRDIRAAGDRGYTPGQTPQSIAAREALLRVLPDNLAGAMEMQPAAKVGSLVLDCVLVNPNEWWLGYHRARGGPSCVPGGFVDPLGMRPVKGQRAVSYTDADDEHASSAELVSRAFLKMEEALWWSRLPIQPGDTVVELGCSPGGSCQALLNRGLVVTGVDPAEVHPDVLANPNFTHIRKRAADVRRREFRKTRWLVADMNVAPEYTLDAVESIVTHDEIDVSGMLLTLKLLDWSLADELPAYLQRIHSWGFPITQVRQLHHGRQEVCVAAQKPGLHRRAKSARATKFRASAIRRKGKSD
jgi:23S rRNA (cytidine2498-2'-O)-methyltransferase